MSVSLSNRVLLRSVVAGALVLASTTACSRSDRTESGSNTDAAIQTDTSSSSDLNSGTGTGASGTDTATVAASRTAAGDTAPVKVQSNAPRAATANPSENGDAAGYRVMERDTSSADQVRTDSARVTEDTTATAETSDGGRSGAVLTAGAAGVAVAAADRDREGSVRPSEDRTETRSAVTTGSTSTAVSDTAGTLQARVDTSHHAEASDSGHAGAVLAAGAAGAAAAASRGDDARPDEPGSTADRVATTESERVRPPEDSTELLGNVNSSETADEYVVRPEDRETVAASEGPTDEVGAAAIAGNVTGSEAVALMTREGVRCAVVDPEANKAVRWDMSSTPVTLNPCGIGSMNLSKVWTEGQRGSGAAGQ